MKASAILDQAPAAPLPPGADLLQRIARRRSTSPRRLRAPGPTPGEIEWIVRAACAAPDHRGLQPFRFEWIGERERERAMHAPTLLALVLRQRGDEVPLVDQHALAGAALGYALLAAECLGYGAMAVSGGKLASDTVRRAFTLTRREHLLCFVAIGTPEKLRSLRGEADLSDRLRRWTSPLTR